MTNIVLEKRPIIKVHKAGDYQTDNYDVGLKGVTEIISYDEGDDTVYVPFLKILKDEKIIARLPARHLHIYYKE